MESKDMNAVHEIQDAIASINEVIHSMDPEETSDKDLENLMARPLVAYEHDHHVAVAVLPGIFQPSGLRRCKKHRSRDIHLFEDKDERTLPSD